MEEAAGRLGGSGGGSAAPSPGGAGVAAASRWRRRARVRAARGPAAPVNGERRRAQRSGAAGSPRTAAGGAGRGGGEPSRSQGAFRTCSELLALPPARPGCPFASRWELGGLLKFWIMFLLSRSAGS